MDKTVRSSHRKIGEEEMSERSKAEIAKWSKLRSEYLAKGYPMEQRDPKMPWREPFKERVVGYKASLILGREFGEDSGAFLRRKGLKEFWEWKP
jgi:hypothetical protein